MFENDNQPLASQKNYLLVSSKIDIKINQQNGDFFIIEKDFVFDFLDLVQEYLIGMLKILNQIDKSDMN